MSQEKTKKANEYKLESDIQKEIEIWCGEHDIIAIRINVGTFLTLYGSYIKAGPPNGYPDLTLLGYGGRMAFCECKNQRGRVRPDQKTMHEELRRRGFLVIVPKSMEDFLRKAEETKLLEYLKITCN